MVRIRLSPAESRVNRRFLVIVTVASARVANTVHHRHVIGAFVPVETLVTPSSPH